jgi:hypothetical protein
MLTQLFVSVLSFLTLLVDADRDDKGPFRARHLLNKRLYIIVFQGATITYPDKPSFVTSSEFKNVPQGYVASPTSARYHSTPSVVQASIPSQVSHQGFTTTSQVGRQNVPTPSIATGVSKQGAIPVIQGTAISRQSNAQESVISEQTVAGGSTPIYQNQESLLPVSIGVTSLNTAATSSISGFHACTPNGTIVCIGPSQYGFCNNGVARVQKLAQGTHCSNGNIYKL